MRRVVCALIGHKIRRHRRLFLLPGMFERCERCGQRVPLN
jgi:hypothetical protein